MSVEESIAQKIGSREDGNLQIDYGCSICGELFPSEELCEEHLSACEQSGSSASISDNERANEYERIRQFDDDLKQNSIYVSKASSQMLSDNEMLITLPYDECMDSITEPFSFSNEIAIGFEQQHTQILSNFSLECRTQFIEETTDIPAISCEAGSSSAYGEDQVKRLTVLSNVDCNQICQGEVLENNVGVIEQCSDKINDFDYKRGEICIETENDNTNTCAIVGKEAENTEPKRIISPESLNNQQQKVRVDSKKDKKVGDKEITNKKRLIDPVKEKKILDLERKKRKIVDIKSINDKFKNVLYKEIPINAEDKETNEKQNEEQKEFDVYEFYDDEEENEQKKKQEKEMEKDLKRRTCLQCGEVFADAMATLRHKRDAHRFPKLNLTKEQIEPYLRMKPQTQCPLCKRKFTTINRTIYFNHLKTHCDEYEYQCRVCGLKFRRVDHWKVHESRHIVPPEDVEGT